MLTKTEIPITENKKISAGPITFNGLINAIIKNENLDRNKKGITINLY